jgi:hypothetical protein
MAVPVRWCPFDRATGMVVEETSNENSMSGYAKQDAFLKVQI